MTQQLWYHDREQFAARLAEADNDLTKLARESGVARTTLAYWKNEKHRIVVGKVAASPDEELIRENAALKLENSRLRLHATKTASGDTATERVLQRIEAAVATNRPRFEPVEFELRPGERTPQEIVLLTSDYHASEVVTLRGTQGINEYDWSVMLERMAGVQRSVLSHAQHFGFAASKLHIPMLGDMLSGDIHDELAITNDRPTAEAVVDLAYDFAEWLKGFTDFFPLISVKGVAGNHPRRTRKPSFKEYHNNADWLFYKMLEALLRGHPQFEFDFPRSWGQTWIVADRWRVLSMHGDGIRTTMPGVPWGGVHRRITTIEAQMQKARSPLDFVFLGHWHTANSLDGIQAKTVMNGALKGADEYAIQQFGSGRDAEQTMMTFHPKRGMTGLYPLQLQPVVPASEGWS